LGKYVKKNHNEISLHDCQDILLKKENTEDGNMNERKGNTFVAIVLIGIVIMENSMEVLQII
jgi:hypothetical protein